MIIPIIPITLPSAPKGLQVTLSLRLGGPGGGPWPLLATPPAGAEPLAGFWSAGGGLAGACTCTHHGLSSAPPVWWLVTCAGGAGAWLTVPALCSLPCLPGAGGWPSPAHEGRYIVAWVSTLIVTPHRAAVPGRCLGGAGGWGLFAEFHLLNLSTNSVASQDRGCEAGTAHVEPGSGMWQGGGH